MAAKQRKENSYNYILWQKKKKKKQYYAYFLNDSVLFALREKCSQ